MQTEQIIKHDSVQVMLDLETMGLRTATAPIISLGAVKFTLADGIIDRFKVNISLKDQISVYGKIAEQGTIDWWKKQGDNVLQRSMSNAKSPKEALDEFDIWCTGINYIWANGIDFDFPKLVELYHSVYNENKKVPWNYWQQLDYRTILTTFGYDNRKVRALQESKSGAVYHDALSDSEGQAEFIINILKALYD